MSETPKEPLSFPLRDEIALFNLRRSEWLKAGKLGLWVAIKGDDVRSFFPDMAEAYAAGASAFGSGPFLVREISEKDEPIILHRFRPTRRRA